jgi:hypothetical protein
MRIDAPIFTGSFSLNGNTLGSLASVATTGSNTFIGGQSATSFAGDQLTANDRAYLRRIDGIAGTTIEVIAPISASAGITGSTNFDTIVNKPTLVSGSSQVIDIISSLNTYTGSNDTTNTNQNNRLGSLENLTGSLATTGSNSFYGTQVFSGSVFIANDLVVQGSSSIQYISASSVSIGTNIVQLNTATPSVRYAGLSVQDSGSSAGVTGSMLWDSLCNRWIYSNPSTIGYSGGMLLSGPRTQTLGTEPTLTCNYIAKSGGGDHLYDSCIIDDGTTTCIKNNLIGTGTATIGSDIILSAANPVIYGGTAEGGVSISNNTGGSYIKIFGASHATTPNTTAFINANSTVLTISNTGVATFACSVSVGGILFPTTQTISTAGTIGFNCTQGIFIYGKTGTSYDFKLYNGVGSTFMQVPTGTQNVEFLGAATFSNTITANGGNILSCGASYGIVQVKGCGASTWQMFANPSDEMRFGRSGVGDYLTIANTGAATFTCSVQASTSISAGTYLGASRNGSDTIGSGPYLVLSQTSNSRQWIQQMGASLSLDFYHYNGSAWIQPLILAASGDITIACNVRVGGLLTVGGDTSSYQIKSSDYNFSGGWREMFRVSHVGLTTSGRFTLNGTGNSFVHSSQWAWSSTHNGGYGRGRIIQLTGGEYSDVQFALDTTPAGDIIISANFGTSYTLNLFIEKVRGGAIDTSNQNADRTSAPSGYTRVQTITSIPYGSQFYKVVAETLGGSGNRAVYSDSGGSLTNSSSDVTLKKNVENITHGINSIMALRPISFNWIPENLGKQKEIGFIAQEVQELIPEVIGTNKDETLSLDYPKLTAVLIKGMQEQQCIICSQSQKIALLESCIGIV